MPIPSLFFNEGDKAHLSEIFLGELILCAVSYAHEFLIAISLYWEH
jgi:hypothetical protein